MEIAFNYKSNLLDLQIVIDKVWDIIHKLADKLNMIISHEPILCTLTSDISTKSPMGFFTNLRSYRRKLLLECYGEKDECAANYAAGIISTQIHIGGINIDDFENTVPNYYTLEPKLLSITANNLTDSFSDLLYERWKGYDKVFNKFPLIGFPKMNKWNIEEWINAIFETPLYGQISDSFAGKCLKNVDYSNFTIEDILYLTRDLQIIKPRFYKTFEFRSDPAQNSPKRIIALAALRLGLFLHCRNNNGKVDFMQYSNEWWNIVRKKCQPYNLDSKLIELALVQLKKRNFNEEHLLSEGF